MEWLKKSGSTQQPGPSRAAPTAGIGLRKLPGRKGKEENEQLEEPSAQQNQDHHKKKGISLDLDSLVSNLSSPTEQSEQGNQSQSQHITWNELVECSLLSWDLRNQLQELEEFLDHLGETSDEPLAENPVEFDNKGSQEALQGGQEAQQGGQEALQGGQEALQGGQEALQGGQEVLRGGQEALHGGQEALRGGQEARQGGQEALQGGQEALWGSQEALQGGAEAQQGGQESCAGNLDSRAPPTFPSPGKIRETVYMMRQTTLGEAGAATSAEAPGANNVVPPLVSALGVPVATPECVLTAPALTADCGKETMQLAVSATTSDRALGTNSTETFPDSCGEVPEANSDEVLAWAYEQVKLVCRQRKTARNRRKHMKKKMKIQELRETVYMMRQTTLGEAGAATSAEAPGANNVFPPLVSALGVPVATPECVLMAPALTADCGKDTMQLAVSATTSDRALGTNNTGTLPDSCGKHDEVNGSGEECPNPFMAAILRCQKSKNQKCHEAC